MKNLFVFTLLLFGFTQVNAQNGPTPRKNLIKIDASYGGEYWSGIGIGYERILGKRQYIGLHAFTNGKRIQEGSLGYKLRFMRIGRFSFLGGANLNYSRFDYSDVPEEDYSGEVVSFNPLIETRLRVTRKVDLTATYNFKSTTLHHVGIDRKAVNQGWGVGVNIKF